MSGGKVQKVISLILATAGGRSQGIGKMSQNVNLSTQQKIDDDDLWSGIQSNPNNP